MSFIELKKVCKQYPGTENKSLTDFDMNNKKKEIIEII